MKPRSWNWIWFLLVEIALVVTNAGSLPVPGPGRAITVLHVPVILTGVLFGPLAGAIVGLVFGLGTLYEFPADGPIVMVVPRVLIGVVSALTFRWALKRFDAGSRISLGSLVAAIAGSLTNTLGVTLLGIAWGEPVDDVLPVMALHGLPELALAVVVTVPAAITIYHTGRARKRRVSSR